MKRCIIHIGMHKTGSTSIQRSLQGYRDDRFQYARLGKTANHSLAMYSLFAADPWCTYEPRRAEPRPTHEESPCPAA